MAIYRGTGGSVEGITEADILSIAISQGGTGAQTAAGARTNLGLGTAATTAASDYATAAQGTLADSAVQPGDIGTAAAQDVGYFATAAQGTLADSATQPGDLATVATSGSYNDLTDKPTIPTGLDSLTDVVITSATTGQGLQYNGTNWVNSSAGSGTVTSVAMSVPTGLSISGSPVTTTGTLAVTLTSGYAIPTTAKQTEWDTAYGWGNHASAGYLTTETYTGTVTSVGGTGTVNGLSLSGTVTSSGNLTLGGTLDLSSPPAIGGTAPSTGSFSTLKVGSSSILGNANADVTLGVAVRNSGATLGYFQIYNSNAGADLKTWRLGNNGSGSLVFETVNDAYSSSANKMTLDTSGNLTAATFNGTIDGGTY